MDINQEVGTRPYGRVTATWLPLRTIARFSTSCLFAVTQFRSFSFGTTAVLSKPPHPFTRTMSFLPLEDSLPTVGIGCYYTIVCATATGNRKKCHSWFVSAFRTIISPTGTRNERAGSPFYCVGRDGAPPPAQRGRNPPPPVRRGRSPRPTAAWKAAFPGSGRDGAGPSRRREGRRYRSREITVRTAVSLCDMSPTSFWRKSSALGVPT